MKILLVEDDPSVRMFDSAYLEEEGYDVVSVTDGQEALEALGPDINLIVTDVRMPRLDGRELAVAARELGFDDIPLIFKSGFPQPDLENDFPTCSFLEKPYFPEDLIAVVDRQLRGRNALQAGEADQM